MKKKNGSPSIYLIASTPEARSLKHTRNAATMLEECRHMLVECGQVETVQLLDIALLQLRMQMRGISEADLNTLCAALADAGPANDQLRDADGG